MLSESLLYQLVRAFVIYLFTLAMLRIAGKRRLTRLSAFDILIIISLGSAVGDVMVYPESVVPLSNAILAIFTVILLQILISKLIEHNKLLAYIIEGRGALLILNGKVLQKSLEKEDLTIDDLQELLREKGIVDVKDVREAILETSGELSVILKKR